MDVDIVKTPNNMDVMAMMIQPEKFPELFSFSDPFLFTPPYPQEPDLLSSGSSSTSASTLIFNNATTMDPPSKSNNLYEHPPPQQNTAATTEKKNSMAAMREMIFRIAVMQPVHIDPESIKPPKRRNVRISKDPQSVAARHRRERISQRIRILQRLVPGGTKMDTASMLDEAIHYVKFLKKQVQTLEQAGANSSQHNINISIPNHALGFPLGMSSNYSNNNNNNNNNVNYSSFVVKGCQQPCQVFGSTSKQLLS